VTEKWGQKNARNNFSRNTRIVRAKNVWKKSSLKSAKKHFLYSHEYRGQKMGWKKCAKEIFQKHTNSARKKCWEKIVGKSEKKHFLYSHEYRNQKKMQETIFPETHE